MAAEIDELSAIKDLIEKSGSSGFVGERITHTLQQLRKRLKLVSRTLETGFLSSLNEYRARRFSIEDSLLGLSEQFSTKRDTLAATLIETEIDGFITHTNTLLNTYRTVARDEKSVLTELVSLGQQMQVLTLQRLETLTELRRFIRARAFWLRVGKPIELETFRQVSAEIQTFFYWISNVYSGAARANLTSTFSSSLTLIYALLLFPVLPLVVFFGRQELRAMTRRINDRVVADGQQTRLLSLVLFTGVMSAALIPLYFLAAARLLDAVNLPTEMGFVVSTLFEHLVFFLFLWFLSRSFFAKRSIAEVQFGMPAAAANAFYAALGCITEPSFRIYRPEIRI